MSALTPRQQALVANHRHVATRATRRYARVYRQLLTRDEIEQAASLALTEAAMRFDEAAGVPFAGFAWSRIEGAILRLAGKETRARKLRSDMHGYMEQARRETNVLSGDQADARAELVDHARCAMIAMMIGLDKDTTSGRPDEEVMHKELRDALAGGMAHLDDQQRRLIEQRYFGESTLKQIAQDEGWSPITTRRRHKQALQVLAMRLKAHARSQPS